MVEKALEAVEIAKNTGKLRKGTNEVTKALEKGDAKLVVVAKDVSPKEIIMHIPVLAKEKGIPFIAVPTTAGTGAEMTPNAVISDETKNTKKSIRTPDMFPHYAVLDAKLTLTCPQTVTAYSGANSLLQAIEASVSIVVFNFSLSNITRT